MTVVTAGETMALLDPVGEGKPELGCEFALRIAGAESNFAIALARLGIGVRWISRLGTDPLGDVVHATLAAEGLDLRYVKRDASAPTGLFLKWRVGGRTQVSYYRKGSAASRLEPGDVPDEALDDAELVHLTGITMALGDGPRELVLDVARRARAAGAIVTFDPNYRPALWESPEAAARAMEPVLEHVSWYLCGADDALFEPDAVVERVIEGVVARTAGSALVATRDTRMDVAPPRREEVVDEVGAGDAFAAGFAFGLLQGWEAPDCVRAAHTIAARALRGTGDWETLPRRADVFS
jgi:2-dehydro-3-deoxygluconokinase